MRNRTHGLFSSVGCFAALWMAAVCAHAGNTWGGRGYDAAYAVAADAQGATYVAGTTDSIAFGGSGRRSSRDVFIAKFNSAAQLVYLTYLGGSGTDAARAIVVDSSGNTYVAGTTNSPDFSTTPGAVSRTNAGLDEVFVAKLDASGSVVYSTLLGSSAADEALGIAADLAGNVYVTGRTAGLFPTTSGSFQRFKKGSSDCFVTKLNAPGSSLVYSTLLGGNGLDSCNSIAVDSSGNAYVTGLTYSSDFPMQAPIRGTLQGDSDGFVAKLNSAGSALVYSTYLGGSSSDSGNAIAVDSTGSAFLAGETFSWDFPTSSGVAPQGGADAFVIKVSPSGGGIVFSTLLGGRGTDTATSISLDGTGRIAIGGVTDSIGIKVRYALQDSLAGSYDGFAAVLNADGLTLFCSYLGGYAEDRVLGIAATPSVIRLVGVTQSPEFPGADPGAVVPGDSDIFLVRVPGGWPDLPPPAQFVKMDTTTRGTWKGTYGGQGYAIVNSAISYPAYVNVVSNAAPHTWVANTSEIRALQQASSSQRIASVWYAPNSITVNLSFNDEQAHQLAVYCLDWDAAGRTQSVEILNAAGVVVDSRQVSGFGNGVWVVWNVAGAVQLRIRRTGPLNAVISGLFFGEAVPPPVEVTVNPGSVTLSGGETQQFTALVRNTSNPAVNWSITPNVGTMDPSGLYTAPASISSFQTVTLRATSVADGTAYGTAAITLAPVKDAASARLIKIDTSTRGTWKGGYGSDGYNVFTHPPEYPAYVTPIPSGHTVHTWVASTSDSRALQQPAGPQRVAGAWYTSGSMVIDLPFTDGNAHELAVYCLDWDNVGRVQTLEMLDMNGNLLDGRTVSGFGSGVWVIWRVSGYVQLKVTRVSGMNAVISGIFFGPAISPVFQRLDTATQGSWRGVYGRDGYQIIGLPASFPNFVTPAAPGASSHTWAPSTTEIRALQYPGSGMSRIAGVWYAPTQFVVDLPFNDGKAHQLSAYFLDWDQLGRAQTIELLDVSGTVLDTRSLSNFGAGVWIVWNVTGPVKLRITRTGPLNAVLSGIFFDPLDSFSAASLPPPTNPGCVCPASSRPHPKR